MKREKLVIALLSAGFLTACGGGSDGAVETQAVANQSESGTAAPQPYAPDTAAEVWGSSKYAGRWRMCIQMSPASSKLDIFEIEAISPTVLNYRQSRTYHGNTDCSLPPGESWADQRYRRVQGTFELLGEMKVVQGINSEKALWSSELTPDFSDTGITEKTTMGLMAETLYIGNTSGALDAGGFPDEHYHVLRRVP